MALQGDKASGAEQTRQTQACIGALHSGDGVRQSDPLARHIDLSSLKIYHGPFINCAVMVGGSCNFVLPSLLFHCSLQLHIIIPIVLAYMHG